MNKQKFDLVVIGGGLAGTCCAVAAAREGLKTALVNDQAFLGGNASPEIGVGPEGAMAMGFNRFADETGLVAEIRADCDRRKTRRLSLLAQVLWEKAAAERNLTLFVLTRALVPVMQSKRRIKALVVKNLETGEREELAGSLFADCSGDGGIAYQAGAAYALGRESSRKYGESLAPNRKDNGIMGATLMFLLANHHTPIKFTAPKGSALFPTDKSLPCRPHADLRGSPWWMEYAGDLDIVRKEDKVHERLYDILFGILDHLKNRGTHRHKHAFLRWVSPYLAKRESRRFLGDHVLTQNDIMRGGRFQDTVAYGGWPIDLHPPGGIFSKQPPAKQVFVAPYGIPFRSLYSKNIENLFLAGRNISVSHVALGSTRVEWTCAVMGQAVGTAAFLCKKLNCSPRQLAKQHIRLLQQRLLRNDCYLPSVCNADQNDLARNAEIKASNSKPLAIQDAKRKEELTVALGQSFPVSERKLRVISLLLESGLDKDVEVELSLYQCRPGSAFSTEKCLKSARAMVRAGHRRWVSFKIDTETIPGTVYWFALKRRPGIFIYLANDEWMGVMRAKFNEEKNTWEKYTGFHDDVEALWRLDAGTYCFRTDPCEFPYGPENIISGMARPELWPHIWISDPARPGFGEVLVCLNKAASFSSVQLTFNNGLNRTWPPVLTCPDCVKKYEISCKTAQGWKRLVLEKDNLYRRRLHKFPSVCSDKIRVRILETHGAPSGQIFEARIYK